MLTLISNSRQFLVDAIICKVSLCLFVSSLMGNTCTYKEMIDVSFCIRYKDKHYTVMKQEIIKQYIFNTELRGCYIHVKQIVTQITHCEAASREQLKNRFISRRSEMKLGICSFIKSFPYIGSPPLCIDSDDNRLILNYIS